MRPINKAELEEIQSSLAGILRTGVGAEKVPAIAVRVGESEGISREEVESSKRFQELAPKTKGFLGRALQEKQEGERVKTRRGRATLAW